MTSKAINALKSRVRRRHLTVRGKPYFESLPGTGVQIGYRAGPGTWIARWFVNGKEIQRSLKSFADDTAPPNGQKILNYSQACKKAIELSNQPVRADIEKCTVAEAFKRYTSSRDAIGKDTVDSWQRYGKWIKTDFGSRRITSLQRAELIEWRDSVARSVKPATVNRTLTIFKACLRFALEELEIPYIGSPIWKALKPLPVDSKARDRYLTPSELGHLANNCDFDLQRLVLAAAYTGARFGDLARLNVSDWDRQLRKVRIQNAKTNRPRFVPVTDQAALFFDQITGRSEKSADSPMLVRCNGARWKKNQYRSQLLKASRNAGIEPPVNFHAIRHSYAAAMKRAGVDDSIIASSLGHTSTKMVQEHYGHLSESHVDEKIRNNAIQLDVETEFSGDVVGIQRSK